MAALKRIRKPLKSLKQSLDLSGNSKMLLPVIHPIMVAGVKHLVNKCRLNKTCGVECDFFDCCRVVFEIS